MAAIKKKTLQELIDYSIAKSSKTKFSTVKSSGASGEVNLSEIIKEEGERLKKILIKHVQAHYESYTPVMYQTTYQMIDSITLDEPQSKEGLSFIQVYFDKDKATHPSIFNGKPGYVPQLIDQGWEVKKDVSFKDVPMLGFFEGAGFVDAAVEEYEKVNPYGFKVSVSYPYKKRK